MLFFPPIKILQSEIKLAQKLSLGSLNIQIIPLQSFRNHLQNHRNKLISFYRALVVSGEKENVVGIFYKLIISG